jgi:hypothetical protein
MREAVEGGSGEPFAAEHLGPLIEGQVRGDDQALPLVGGAQNVKKHLGPYLPGGNVAQFIKDERVELLDLLAEPQELLLLPGFHEQRDQLGHPEEPDSATRHRIHRYSRRPPSMMTPASRSRSSLRCS